jgi:hypothetical protein
MVIFSPITIGLGIADLALMQQFCVQSSLCTSLSDALALTWVAVAIWAPIPIFVNGIGAIWIAGRPFANNGWLCLLSFLNTIAFGPVIVIVTALELAKKFSAGVPSMNTITTGSPPVNIAMFGIEITIAVIGAVLFLHALAILYLNCCCVNCLHEEMAHTTGPHFDAVGNEVYVERRKTPVNPRGPTPDPAQDEIDRMNIWSAYRWMNNGGAVAPPVTRTNYYAVGAAPTRCAPGGYSGVAGPYCHGPRNVLAGGPAAARW